MRFIDVVQHTLAFPFRVLWVVAGAVTLFFGFLMVIGRVLHILIAPISEES